MILSIGKTCLDIVMSCSSYPEEDSDQRCESLEWRRGGNASNSCTIFAEFGTPCEYLGVMSLDLGGRNAFLSCFFRNIPLYFVFVINSSSFYYRFLKQDFEKYGISINNCIFSDCSCPTSVVLINSNNGSRTIVHSDQGLPPLTFEHFSKLDLCKYKWIHFELQHSVEEIKMMINHIDDWNAKHVGNDIVVSVEIEKPKPSYIDLISYAHVVFISKDFAKAHGFTTMRSAVETLSEHLKSGSSLICPWSQDGACARTTGESIVTSVSYPPEKVIDTLGAGDTFVAVTILSLLRGNSLQKSIEIACRVAGAKCGFNSMTGLRNLFPKLQR